MLALWLAMCALAVLPELHRLVHADSQTPDHQCLLTQVQQHLLLGATGLLTVPAPPLGTMVQGATLDLDSRFEVDYRVSASRAPPRF
jgi:hypothetical protein